MYLDTRVASRPGVRYAFDRMEMSIFVQIIPTTSLEILNQTRFVKYGLENEQNISVESLHEVCCRYAIGAVAYGMTFLARNHTGNRTREESIIAVCFVLLPDRIARSAIKSAE